MNQSGFLYLKTPITIAFEHQMIYDNGRKGNNMSQKEWNTKRAKHITCKKGLTDMAQAWIHAWLHSSNKKCYTNLPMKYIPTFLPGLRQIHTEKHKQAALKHMKITTYGIKQITPFDLNKIDSSCELIEGNPSSQELTLSMKLRTFEMAASNGKQEDNTKPDKIEASHPQ